MNSGAADIKIIHGVRLVRLHGTRDQRAVQHGRILASLKEEERLELAIQPLATKNQSLIRNATPRLSGMRGILEKLYEAYVFKCFALLPKEYRSRLKPFQKASKLSDKKLWLALYQPDLLMSLASLAHERARNLFLSGMPGCTSGAICENGKNQDAFLFLRNLDYPAASFWEKWPAVFYHEPTEPSAQKYVSISSIGIHTPGLTGWNERGIAFSLHAHFSKKTSTRGVPIFFLGEDLLENARTMEEAILLCRKFKPIGSWAINLVSAKEKKAVTVEMVNGAIAVNPMHDHVLSHSNGFVSDVFQENEIYFNGAFFQDVRARKKTMTEGLIKAREQGSTIPSALDAISSHVDHTTGETRVYGNTVSLVTTIQSIVMDLKSEQFYLSIRGETPTPLGPFLKLPFHWGRLNQKGFEPEFETPTTKHSEGFLKAAHAYSQAYIAWQVRGQGSKKGGELAHAFLVEATDAAPEDPHLWIQRGYFELLHHEPKVALHCFREALKFRISHHYHAVAKYFQAASLDILGGRDEALAIYEHLLAPSTSGHGLDPKLRKKVEKRLQRPYLASYCQKIVPDLQFVEPLEYL